MDKDSRLTQILLKSVFSSPDAPTLPKRRRMPPLTCAKQQGNNEQTKGHQGSRDNGNGMTGLHILPTSQKTQAVGPHLIQKLNYEMNFHQNDDDHLGSFLKHHLVYHQGKLPDYWTRIQSKHLTAFNCQVTEGSLITCAMEDTDVILNSKGETISQHITRKVVTSSTNDFTMVVGNKERFSKLETKLLD